MFVEIEYASSLDITELVWINVDQIADIIPQKGLPKYVSMSNGKRFGPLTQDSMERLGKVIDECC